MVGEIPGTVCVTHSSYRINAYNETVHCCRYSKHMNL